MAMTTRLADPNPTTAPKTKAVITTGETKHRGDHGMNKRHSHQVRVSLKSDQANADAEWIFENIMHRQNYTATDRDKLAAYLTLVVADAPREGKVTAKRAKARGGAGKV